MLNPLRLFHSSSDLLLSPPVQILSLGSGKHACCEHWHLEFQTLVAEQFLQLLRAGRAFDLFCGGGLFLGFFWGGAFFVLLFSLIFTLLKNLLPLSAGSQELVWAFLSFFHPSLSAPLPDEERFSTRVQCSSALKKD